MNIGVNQAQSIDITTSTTGTRSLSKGYWSSATSGGNLTVTVSTSSTSTIILTHKKTKYHILGEDFEIEGYFDNTWLSMQISQLNTYAKIGLARVYYEELKKNNIFFPDDIDKIIQKRLLAIERNIKINSVIDEK